MSDNTSLKTFLIEEPRISKITDQLKIGVKDGPAASVVQKYRANSNSSTSTLFNVNIPSINTLVDRHLTIECVMTFYATFTVPAPAAGAAQETTTVSALPSAFPMNQSLQSASITINNSKLSVQSSDVLNILTKQYHQKYLSQHLQGTPNYVDKYFALSSDAEKMKHQSGSWWSNCASGEKDSDTVGRGDSDCSILLFGPNVNGENIMYNSFTTVAPGDYRIQFNYKVKEPIFGLPGCELHENEGCFLGVNQIELVLQYGQLSNACNVHMSTPYNLNFSAGDPDSHYMNLLNDDAKLVTRYLSLHMNHFNKLKPRNLISFDEYVCYKTVGERALNADISIQSNVISMRQVPDLIYLCIRPQQRDQSALISNNFCFTSQKLNITFNNMVGLLSDHSLEDLYVMSRRNGSYQTWNEFRGLVKGASGVLSKDCISLGSIIVIDPSRDLSLSDFLSASSLGQFSFQANVEASGRNINFCTRFELAVICSYAGVLVTEKGVSQTLSGLLNMDSVLSAKKNGSSNVDYTDIQKLAGGSLKKGKTMVGNILKNERGRVSVSVDDKEISSGKVSSAIMAHDKLSKYM